MLMNFDFTGNDYSKGTVGTGSHLEANKIHDVKFVGLSLVKTDKGERAEIEFEGVNGGTHKHILWPFDHTKKEDMEPQMSANGFKNPSKFQTTLMVLKHLSQGVAPQMVKEMEDGTIASFKPVKSKESVFSQYINWLSQHINAYAGAETQIKLIRDNKGYASFPAFPTSLSKTGQVYLKTNFIGSDLFFTDKEMLAIAVMNAAQPTVMPSTPENDPLSVEDTTTTDDNSSDDLDLDIEL